MQCNNLHKSSYQQWKYLQYCQDLLECYSINLGLLFSFSLDLKMAPIVPKTHEGGAQTPSSPGQHKTFTFEIKEKFVRQSVMMSLWFVFSFGSIISNKYILSTLDGDAGILGETQMVCSVIFGALKMYLPCCLFHRTSGHHQDGHKFHFFRNMAILGWMR